VLPIYLGIALVMGENIGTTATANLAALGANRQARRAALAHLIFNMIGVIWVMILFYPFVNMVLHLANGASLPVVLATFHTCFNVTNTLLLIGFIPHIEKICCKIITEKQEEKQDEFKLQYIENSLIKTPEIAVLQAQKETGNFGYRVQQMFGMVARLIHTEDDKQFEKGFGQIANEEDYTDKMELAIAHFLEDVSNAHLSDETKEKIRQMLRELDELESIGDACYNLGRVLERQHQSGKKFTENQMGNINKMMTLVEEALNQMNLILKGKRDEQSINESYQLENSINTLRNELKKECINEVENRDYEYLIGSQFIDFINECERLGDYVINVVQARVGH